MWPVRLAGSLVREKTDRCCLNLFSPDLKPLRVACRVNDVLGKTVPSIDYSLGEEVTSGVQTTPIVGNLDCVSSFNCNIAEREHALRTHSRPSFIHSEDPQHIVTITPLFLGPK